MPEVQIKVEDTSLRFYKRFIHFMNFEDELTNKEIDILAIIMSKYPKDIDSNLRQELVQEVGANNSYISQVLKSLKSKGYVNKQSSVYFISNNRLIQICKLIVEMKNKKLNSLKLGFNINLI